MWDPTIPVTPVIKARLTGAIHVSTPQRILG